MLVTVVLCHRATGLTRGYRRSTDAPVETSTVLPRDDVMREATDVSRVTVSSVTQASDIHVVDRDDAGRGPVSAVTGVDRGLLGPARRRGQSLRGSYPGHLYDNYPPFPSTTIRPKRGSNKNIYVSFIIHASSVFNLSKVFLILSVYNLSECLSDVVCIFNL